MKHLLAIALLSVLAVTPCWAQGTVTDGSATFTWVTFAVNINNADYSVGGGPDHVFENWWYFRVLGDTDETPFPAPDTENYTGNVATLGWTDVAARGLFDAQLVTTVIEGGGGASSYVEQDLTITSISSSTLALNAFNYLDFDLTATSTEDQAALVVDPTYMSLFDATTNAEFQGVAASEFQVTDTQGGAASLRSLLSDGLVTNLDGSGLPFGPADYEGAFQWGVDIPASGSVTLTESYSIQGGIGQIFADGFESGDTTTWSSTTADGVVLRMLRRLPRGPVDDRRFVRVPNGLVVAAGGFAGSLPGPSAGTRRFFGEIPASSPAPAAAPESFSGLSPAPAAASEHPPES